MRPNSHEQNPTDVPRTMRREQPAQVVQFRSGSPSYTPREHNPYDGYDAIDTEDYNPYDEGDLIDPNDDDADGGSGEWASAPRQRGAQGPRRIVRRRTPAPNPPAPSGGYGDGRGGYPLGVDTPVSSYDERGYAAGSYAGAGPGGGAPRVPSGGAPKPRPPRRRHRFRHRGLAALIVVVVALVAIYQLVFAPVDKELAFSDAEGEGLSQELSTHIPATPYYALLLGSDARDGDTVSRSDTMILARIDPIESKVTLVSIPRDTMVQIEGHGTQKINAAYAFGGAAGAVKAVNDLTGVSISHVAVVKFDGVSNLVDYLGGVTVNVPVAVNDPSYTGLVLPAGEQTMDGNTAMLFSRVRHGFAQGDYQRQEDQRILIQAILAKCLTLSPAQVPGLVDTVGGLVSTDMHCYSILPLLARFAITHPTIYSCSLHGTTKSVGGASYEVLDSSQVHSLMARVDAGDDPSTDSATAAQQAIG